MIAIKGMEKMPKSCADCERGSICGYGLGYGRPDDCPLVEIVTCKDCRHCYPDEDGRGYHCERDNNVRFSVHRDFYCADAERRE